MGQKAFGGDSTTKIWQGLKEDVRIPGPFPVFGSSGIVGMHQTALSTGPAIIVGRKGNVGSVYWSERDFWPIDTVYFIESEKCSLYLYYALQHVQFISTNVAVPGLNRDFVHSRKLFSPDTSILRLFEEFTTPLHEQISTQARDMLLPRLMNGDIAV